MLCHLRCLFVLIHSPFAYCAVLVCRVLSFVVLHRFFGCCVQLFVVAYCLLCHSLVNRGVPLFIAPCLFFVRFLFSLVVFCAPLFVLSFVVPLCSLCAVDYWATSVRRVNLEAM